MKKLRYIKMITDKNYVFQRNCFSNFTEIVKFFSVVRNIVSLLKT